MNLQARTKKTIAVIAVALLIVGVAFVAVMVQLVGSADRKLPEITAYAYGKSVTVEPTQHCNLYLEDCIENPLATLDVPPGEPLQLSLPTDIADAPWRLIAVYGDVDTGRILDDNIIFEPGQRLAVTVPADPTLQLLGIEVQLPSAVVDEAGKSIAHAVWGLQTF